MDLQVERRRSRTVVMRLIGRFDASQTDRVKQVWLSDPAIKYILIDLGETEFIDSLALAALVSGLKVARQREGELIIIDPSEAVQVIFELTRMDAAFRIVPTTDEAVQLVDASVREPVTIALDQRLDGRSATDLRAAVQGELERGNIYVILDASATRFIDSTGMAALVTGHKAAQAKEGVVVIVGLNDGAREVFEMTRMDQVFSVYGTVEDAKAALLEIGS